MTRSPRTLDRDADWQQFVLANGSKASGYELASCVGQPVEDIERVRRTGACSRLSKGKDFAELFSLWHGRAPTDAEWPVPRKIGSRGAYQWQEPELALLATLVGQLGAADIARSLTNRLRKLTGDSNAERTLNAVQVRINHIGMQSTDVLGGITTTTAGREIGSSAIVHQAIHKKQLRPIRVGRLWVIPHAAWEAWKAKRVFPPAGYVQLSTIRESLSIRSDKLSEFARMGLIPTAVRCNPYGTKGRSTQFGTWYIDKQVAAKLLKDRRAGRAMPWHGKYADNLRVTFKLWQARQHPASCKTCAEIWGENGAPKSFEAYSDRYPPLAHGAKMHLTRPWNPGMTVRELAVYAGCSEHYVRRAISNGMVETTVVGRRQYVSRTNAARWRARKCPTGDSQKSWISLDTARDQYLFTLAELRGFIAGKKLKSKTGTDGAARGVVYVSRHQCGQLREKLGFTEEQAARRAGVTVPRLRHLLKGVTWRKAEGIPLTAVQTVIKRLESHQGYTLDEAAAKVGMPVQWVRERQLDGTIRTIQSKWDRRRVYVTEIMVQRLQAAKQNPVEREQFNADWLRLSEAANEAGVSAATIIKWAELDELDRRQSKSGWRYHRAAVRARARRYWGSVRFHRATPPDWLAAESASAAPVRRRVSQGAGKMHHDGVMA